MLDLPDDWKLRPKHNEIRTNSRILFAIKDADQLEGVVIRSTPSASASLKVRTNFGELTVEKRRIIAVHQPRKVKIEGT